MGLTNNYWPNPSFESSLTLWTGTRAPTRVVDATAAVGGAYARVTAVSGDTMLAMWTSWDTTTMVGKTVSLMYQVRGTAGTTRWNEPLIAFFDSTSTLIAQTVGPRVQNSSAWRTAKVENVVVPAGTARIVIQNTVRAASTGTAYTPTAGIRTDVDALIVTDGATVSEYRDGNSGEWIWLGTPNESQSRQHSNLTPTLYPDMNPCPRTEVYVEGLLNAKATLWRTVPGRAPEKVRGAVNVSATDAMSLFDYEAPFSRTGAQSTYRVEMFDAAGMSLGFTQSVTASLAFTGTVVQQPLDPQRAVLVQNASSRNASRNRPFDGSYQRAPASAYGTWLGQGRHGLRDLALKFRTQTEADYDGMVRVFGDYGEVFSPVVCIRTSENEMKLPNPLYVAVDNPNPIGLDWHMGGHLTEWSWQAQEVTPPAPTIVVAAMSYDDLTAAYDLYTTFTGDNWSYIGAARRFEFAGLT